ncbi:MAG: hypothetical protein ABIQ31_09965 [Ferruginibacter sp.]
MRSIFFESCKSGAVAVTQPRRLRRRRHEFKSVTSLFIKKIDQREGENYKSGKTDISMKEIIQEDKLV